MTDKNDMEQNADQTLITLDQLSQTLEVMSCVVDRLKDNLTRQMSLNAELFQDEENLRKAAAEERKRASAELKRESFVVEITQQELEDDTGKKIVH